jgi:hypothetical protein
VASDADLDWFAATDGKIYKQSQNEIPKSPDYNLCCREGKRLLQKIDKKILEVARNCNFMSRILQNVAVML